MLKIEVDLDHITMILPMKTEVMQLSRKQAEEFSIVLEKAAETIVNKDFSPQKEEIKINNYKYRSVVIFFPHTDRIILHYNEAKNLALAVRTIAQDIELFREHDVKVRYDGCGRIVGIGRR